MTKEGTCNFCPEGEAVQLVNIHTPNGDPFLADVCYECFLRARDIGPDTIDDE